jgi:hypothetical protein
MTKLEMNTENALVAEKYLVVKELMQYLFEVQYDRTTITSVMLRELRHKINEMLKNDF